MLPVDVRKWVGVVDGVLVAALVALGNGVPAWKVYTDAAEVVLGVVGSLLGATAAVGK